MKKILLLFVLTTITIGSFAQPWLNNLPQYKEKGELTFFDYQNAFEKYWKPFNVENGYYIENGVEKKAIGWKQFKRWEWNMEGQVNVKTGEFPIKTAKQVYDEFKATNPIKTNIKTANWSVMGPNSSDGGYAGVGRINCIAFHPSDNNTYWVGAASGGLWVTNNNGGSWTCLTDDNGVLGISDIVIPANFATSNIIYIATGDKDSWDNRSIGVLKSTDSGVNWSITGISYSLSDGDMVTRLLLDPNDDNTIIAATTNGVFKTTDGGTTWSTQLTSTSFIDMEYKPGDFTTLYGSTQSGYIYVSANSGSTWSQSSDYGERIELAVTPANSSIVYALVSASDNGLESIQKSTNSGSSFTQVFSGSTTNLLGWDSDGNDSGGQGFYDLSLAVSPSNSDIVIVGGINSWRSTDGGASWSIITHWWGDGVQAVHADVHQLNYRSNGDLFSCNDGGIYYSSDNGTNFSDKSNGLVISQMYKLGVSQTVSTEVITGLQDNGTKLVSGGTWNDVKGGDGMECLIDYSDVNIQYGTYVRGQISRTTNHWSSSTDIEPAGAGDGAWVTPYIIDPINHNTLYAGYANVWKTTNQGDNWTEISSMNSDEKLRSMAIAPSDNSVFYVADYEHIWKTTNGGSTWTDITGTLPISTAYLRYITVKNDDSNTLWVTMSGYTNPGVYESTDGGSSWTNISTGLPLIPTWTVVQNTQVTGDIHLYAGTELGIYFKKGIDNWVEYNTGLPNVKIGEIEIYYDANPVNSKLRAATYGRGLWETSLELEEATFPAPENLAGILSGVDVDLTWDAPSTISGWNFYSELAGANSYFDNNLVTRISFYDDAEFSYNYPIKISELRHAFYDFGVAGGGASTWTDGTFKFVILAEDRTTVLYESPEMEAEHYTDVNHVIPDGIVLSGDFYMGIQTISTDGTPSSLSELMTDNTNNYHSYGFDGTGWFYLSDGTNAIELSQGIYIDGTKNNKYTEIDNSPIKNEIDTKQFSGKINKIENLKADIKSTLTGYQVYKDGLTLGGILPISQLTYTDADVCGSYDYYVTALYTGETGESDASNTVHSGNGTEITDQPVDVNTVVGEDISFNVTATGDNLAYQWRYNSSDISGAENNTYSITDVQLSDAGNYDVTVSGNCGELTSDVAVLAVGSNSVKTLSELGIEIYPNPSDGMFYIRFNEYINDAKIIISDITGKVIYTEVLDSSLKHEIQLNPISKGVYFIQFNLKDKTLISKLIIE